MQKRKSAITARIDQFNRTAAPLDDTEVLLELAREAGDQDQDEELTGMLDEAEALVDELELASILSGPNDEKDAFMSINAGAGGTESQDWAEMLVRMYLRYCDIRGWKVSITDYQAGDEAGI